MTLESIVLLDKTAAEQPIQLPEHPYITSLKNFGVGEILAGGIDLGTTTLANSLLSEAARMVWLPWVGPVTEKGVFYLRTLVKAKKIHDTTPESKRRPLSYYVREGLKEGSDDLIKDITIHDPLYVGFMYAGLHFTDIHPAFLSFSSYITGVLIAAGVDCAKNEAQFTRKKKQLKAAGFGHEQYFEARFLIHSDFDAEDAIHHFRQQFHIGDPVTTHYHDQYFQHNIVSYSGRTPKLRLRSRERRPYEQDDAVYGSDPDFVTSMQITFTKAREQKKKEIDQYRFFPAEKEKMWAILPRIASPADIPDKTLRDIVGKLIYKPLGTLDFDRTVAKNEELSLCTDRMSFERPFYILEVKVYKDTRLLQEAMRYIMAELPVVVQQTTHGKSDLFIG
jgi:hypothetical protein